MKAMTYPDVMGMKPKEARREWLRFMADHSLGFRDDPLDISAEWVRLSLCELIFNQGRDAEGVSRKNLEHRLAKFSALWGA